jgi:hypothetical protein
MVWMGARGLEHSTTTRVRAEEAPGEDAWAAVDRVSSRDAISRAGLDMIGLLRKELPAFTGGESEHRA